MDGEIFRKIDCMYVFGGQEEDRERQVQMNNMWWMKEGGRDRWEGKGKSGRSRVEKDSCSREEKNTRGERKRHNIVIGEEKGEGGERRIYINKKIECSKKK